jgi:hypothetical protein
MDVELSVAGPVPRRTHPGRCADRRSPNASALFEAAATVVGAAPDSFPLRGKVGVEFTSEEPLPGHDGYDAATAIEEVLVDAGVLSDERQVDREWHLIDPSLKGRYIVVVRLASTFLGEGALRLTRAVTPPASRFSTTSRRGSEGNTESSPTSRPRHRRE